MTAKQPAASLPIQIQADIVVIGGGSAGAAAAIAAARRGHRVLVVEEQNCLGGVSTAGGVAEWFASREGVGDIFAGAVELLDGWGEHFDRFFNPEYLKMAWQLLAEKAGVQILFQSTLQEVVAKNRRLESVRLLSCSRPLSVSACYFIDASGEGDLGFLAGAEFMQGDPVKGRTLIMSLAFALFDTGRPVRPFLPPGFEPIKDIGELPGFDVHEPMFDGRIYCNMTKIMDHDPTDPLSLSRAECEARRQLVRILHYLQTHCHPTHALCSSGARIGIREGRRLIGDCVLTQDDIFSATPRLWDDGVAVATAQIDFHSLTRPGDAGWRQAVRPYPIPLRCLIARDFENLLMAGKCVSVDQVVHSSCRMTPTCCAMGQAAGTAAAMALEAGARNIRELSAAALRQQLRQDGMELDPAKHAAFSVGPGSDIADEEKGLKANSREPS